MNVIKQIFVSANEPRLRAGWRIMIQLIVFGIIALCLIIPVLIFYTNYDNALFTFFGTLIQGIAITVSVILARRFIDRRSFISLGLEVSSKTIADLIAGIFIAFVMMGFIFGVERALGWIEFVDPKTISSRHENPIWLWGIIFLLTGWQEELWVRGYIFKNLTDGAGKIAAIILSSLFFGVLHLTNPNASWIAAFGIFFAGLFFAFAVLKTNQLWLAIGIHIGWNFFEGPVFGFPVSGINTSGFFLQHPIGPELWTGGAFGPEAGLILFPALALGVCLILMYTHADIREKIT
jgi:hypothetical protein